MSALVLTDAAYRYPGGGGAAVGPVSLEVDTGEFVLITGPTGCGKSTLLRLAAGMLQRHGRGEVLGTVTLDGVDPGTLAPADRVSRIGFVAQEPADQVVAGTIGDEIAFGLESAGWDADRIDDRVAEVLALVGLPADPSRSPAALSGGQRQRLVVGAALAAGAQLLLLDEPIAWIDPESAVDLLKRLRGLADEGVTVVVVEHRIDAVRPYVDRVIELAPADTYTPPPAPAPAPLGDELMRGTQLRWRYGAIEALNGVDISVRAGERVALLGRNGAGKSTLLSMLAGHLGDEVTIHGSVVDVPQDPDLALFCETVRDELAYGATEARLSDAQIEARVASAAVALAIDDLLDRPPQALSRGQRLRTAAAAAMACEPTVLLLDEPTSGQDRAQVDRMMAALVGRTVVFATHDQRLVREHATRAVILEEGRVVDDGDPAEVLA
ncbi:MAG: ABC transporter ATP-binding protein [Proteobacteria bacterium]|nr:ABC transporter ATP-binding protein [Pseudomonadota bacterium]